MGARVSVVAPPTLIPREAESALGVEVSADIRDVADADLVYVLRMQHERMGHGGFVPSLREYAARYGVTHERLRPGQRVMHAGPINRGVELSGAVADDPATLIERQAANGLVVRMAILYDLLAEPAEVPGAREALAGVGAEASRERGPTRPPPRAAVARGGRMRGPVAVGGAVHLVQRPGQAASLVITGARMLDPAAGIDRIGDLVVRDGRHRRRPGGPRGGRRHGACWSTPGFVDPHIHLRTPGREDTEDIAVGQRGPQRPGGFVTVIAMPNTTPVVDNAACSRFAPRGAGRVASVRVGFYAAITVGQQGRR